MKHLLCILWVLLLTSCGTTYQLSTLNHDPIYDDAGNEINVNIIDNEFELARKFRTDDTFRWNFAQYAMRQDMRWNYDFYWNNRMYRRGPFASPSDFYWNSHAYWWNWASNSPFNMGFNHWDPFGFNNYGWGWSYSWNNRRWSSNQWGNPYGWNNYYGWNNGFYNRYRGTNVAYHTGRRGSTMSIRDRIGQSSMIESTKPRVNVTKPRVNVTKPRVNNTRPRVNNTRPRGYGRPELNNNNRNNNNTRPVIRNNNTRPSRTYSPPPRGSSSPVISRPPSRSTNNRSTSTTRRKN